MFKQLLKIICGLKSRFQFEIDTFSILNEKGNFNGLLNEFEMLAQFRLYCERVIYKFLYKIDTELNKKQKQLFKESFEKMSRIDSMMFVECLSFKDSDLLNIIFEWMVGIENESLNIINFVY